MYDMPSLSMLINGYIDVVIVIVIVMVRIIPTNPKPLCNVFAFTSTSENKDRNKKVILKLQTPFQPNKIFKAHT